MIPKGKGFEIVALGVTPSAWVTCQGVTKEVMIKFEQGARFRRVQRHDAVSALRPVPLQVQAETQVQGKLPGYLEGVTAIDSAVEILVGGSRWLRDAAPFAIAEQEGSEAIAATTI